jgi:23S rRNA pseudouridine2605 synthase
MRNRMPQVASYGLARVISKRGLCSRSEAERWVRAGRVCVGGRRCDDPERRTALDATDITVDGRGISSVAPVYLMLNKPRGQVTTRSDEHGRPTVYSSLDDPSLPWLAPVGRLDQASEGLLLFTNDSAWAARVAAPEAHVAKTYHVQVDRMPGESLIEDLRAGVDDAGEQLVADRIEVLRQGEKGGWLTFELSMGRNRQIRRMLGAHGIEVRRLVRVAIGPLQLGQLAKGNWRLLDDSECRALASPSGEADGPMARRSACQDNGAGDL